MERRAGTRPGNVDPRPGMAASRIVDRRTPRLLPRLLSQVSDEPLFVVVDLIE